MEKSVTKRQKQLLEIIYNSIKNNGYSPTFEEMRENLGVSSNQSVIDHLQKLIESKLVKKGGSFARSLVILPLGYKILGQPHLAAFRGFAAAGAPIEAVEIPGEWKSLPSKLEKIEKLEDVFLLKISGDSMINAGIDDGDIVLVKEQEEFVSKDIVLADISGEVTVKRFMSEDKPPYVYLKPENPNYSNILFTDETSLKGKIISVLKNGYWKPVK